MFDTSQTSKAKASYSHVMRKPLRLCLALYLGLAGCTGPGIDSSVSRGGTVPEAGETTAMDVAAGNRRFALALYRKLGEAEEGNIFFSPMSLALAVGPVMAGAADDTRAALARTLSYPVSGPDLHVALGSLGRNLVRESEGTTLAIANALWVKSGFAMQPMILEIARTHYDAEIEPLDFGGDPSGSAARINEWANDRTRGRIPTIVDPESLNQETRLVVTNAVYFLADWQARFNPVHTRDGPFTLTDGSVIQTSLMRQERPFRYHDGGRFTAIDLPYRDERLVMTVLLPKEEGGLGALERELTPRLLDRTLRELDSAEPVSIDLMLPKLTLDVSYQLAQPLSQMGMAVAFTRNADFTGITHEEPLVISNVIQKAFVRVDELGTEAAAVTAVTIVVVGARIPRGIPFHADHPFLLLIRDRETGTILFFGRIVRPET